MKRGRKKLPGKIKELRGTDKSKKSDSPRKEEQELLEKPKKPRGIFPDYALKNWDDIVDRLYQFGLIDKIDGPALIMMVGHLGVAIEALKKLRNEGITRQDENNVTRKNPAYQLFRDSSSSFRKYLSEFGLSPAAREDLGIQLSKILKEEDQATMEQILNGEVNVS